jgi:DNA polymerase elongation subunit (family B)
MLVDLLGARKAVRTEQKLVRDSDPVYWNILEQRQKAIKVSCNSVYGMLLAQATGKLPLAEGGICTTFRGRELNLEMQRIAMERYKAITVYGDTDSIMVKTPYTKIIALAGIKFGERTPAMEDLEEIAGEHGVKDFSREIAERYLEHYGGFKEEYEVCKEMGDVIARDISSHLPKPISLEFENVFVKALFLMKKRYACILLDMDKMVVKADPYKIYTKGIMLARRDNCAWARNLFRDALFNLLMGKTRVEFADIIHSHIHNLLTWRVPMTDLEIVQKLGFDYKSETFPLKLFSEHLVDIGKPARPNDRLAFIVSSTPNHMGGEDPKLGHHYRLSETLREEISEGRNSVDYLYYVERLKNDVEQIFSIGFMNEIAEQNNKKKKILLEDMEKTTRELQERIEEVDREIQEMDTRLMHSIAEGDKRKQTETRRLGVALKRRHKGLEGELKKKEKLLTTLLNKGVEEYDRKSRLKTDVLNLRLDDKMFEHMIDLLKTRKHVMDEISSKKENKAF